MVIIHDVRKAQAFIAVVHKKSLDNKKWFSAIIKECTLAKAVGKPMYALVEEGADIGILNDMPWEKMIHFTNDFDIPGIMTFIDNDIQAGGYYT